MIPQQPITSIRVALGELVAEKLGLPHESGKIDGPVESGDVCCTYPVEVNLGEPATEEIVGIAIRCFQRYVARENVEDATDPAQLETWANEIQLLIAEHENGLGAWFQQWLSTEFDLDAQGIEVIVAARRWNTAIRRV